MSNPENEKIVRRFIEAWSRLDADELADYFADDGVYHNMPAGPVAGKLYLPHNCPASMSSLHSLSNNSAGRSMYSSVCKASASSGS